MEQIKPLLDFLESIKWAIVTLSAILLFRKSISSFLERLIKLNFSHGDIHGSLEAPIPVAIIETTLIQADSKEQPEPDTEEAKPTQEEAGWISKLFTALDDGNLEFAEKLFLEAQLKENDPDTRQRNEALFQYFRFKKAGDQNSLKNLAALVERSQNDTQLIDATTWLSFIYNDINDHESSKALWIKTISKLEGITQKAEASISLAKTELDLDNFSSALKILETTLLENISDEQRSNIYEEISKIFSENKDKYTSAVSLEKSLEYSHGNREKLFNAAFAQSNTDLSKLAIENYTTLINLDSSNAMALNNLAVCAGNIKVRGKQIELYKKAAAAGNTLAMSNLAHIYIQNGFFEEAHSILNIAISYENPHENVGNALFVLKQTQNNEEDVWSKTLKGAQDFQRKIRTFGSALFDVGFNANNWSGKWKTAEGVIFDLTQDSSFLTGSWSTSDQKIGLTSNFVHKITGLSINRSAKLTYTKNNDSPKKTILSSGGDQTTRCLAYISEDLTEILIFANDDTELAMRLYRV